MTTCFRLLASFAAALLGATLTGAQVPTWAKVTPADVTAAGINVQLTGADYGNGTFVLATYFGGSNAVPAITPAVFTSPDGTTWTRRTVPGSGRTGAPRFLNGKFLLGVTPNSNFGGNGVIVSSADGITWTSSANLGATVNAPGEFAYGNGVYAAPLASGGVQVTTSTDGVVWTNRVIVAGGSSSHITFFNGKFYASCYGTPAVAGLYTSADGIAWSKVAGAPAGPGILAATNSTLLVTFFSGSTSGQSLSADGVTFTTASPGINLQTETVKVLNGAFVVTASPSPTSFDLTLARASFDGRTWASIGSTANQFYATEVAFGNGRYVFVGEFDVYSGTTTVTAGGTAGGGGSTGGGSTGGGSTGGGSTGGGSTGGGSTGGGTALTAGYLSNLSIRSSAGSGPQTLIVGVTIGGANTTGSKNVLIRGVGPTLGGFGVPGVLADPKLDVYSGQTVIATNDNWDATATPLTTQTSVGAFALTTGSKDAALVGAAVPAGSYSVQITGVNGTTGIALAEVYDLTPTASVTTTTPRMTNISARTQVGTGGDILITGFNLSGTGQRRLLIRAVGPTLNALGVTGTLADPKLEVFSGQTVVASNDNWDATATPAATQTAAGAFPLTAGSKDAVLIVNLSPGSYTAQVSGVGATTGVALVEIYELP
ncbi:MAG: hypothetical protein NTV51_19065 [Verrucomicrobia bacterium]|nr:hypothetical protein [Verrucomicrobiota bacterium]